MKVVSLEQVLACPTLPTLPAVAVEVLKLAGKRDVHLDEIARAIQNDPALCARILRTVNSSFYGLSKPCPSITRAMAYLGLNLVKSLVLGFSLVDVVNSKGDSEDLQDCWRRSVFSAAACRRLANFTGACDPEEAFLAALIQDIGVLAMRQALGPTYQQLYARTRGDHASLPALCREAFGFDHAEVGAALAQRWRFSPELAQAIQHHHCPIARLPDMPKLVQLVAISNQLVQAVTGPDPASTVIAIKTTISELLGIPLADVDALIAATDDAYEIAQLLTVVVGSYPDVGSILARAEEANIQHQLEIQRESERLEQTNITLAQQNLTDALTGIGNRKQFDLELETQFLQARSFKGCMSVLMLDIDKFKAVNDQHGHPAGDAVLIELARRVRRRVDQLGTVCRYGGEEFGVILPGSDSREAAQLAEAIRTTVATTPINLPGSKTTAVRVNITVSVGVASYQPASTSPTDSAQALVQAADQALYAAKQAGRNCVGTHTHNTHKRVKV